MRPIKKPISLKKLAANRANAKKSRGPVTEEGKQAVRNNALKHGMYSSTAAVVLPIDDPALFHSAYCEWHRCYTPRDYEELNVLNDFTAAHWRYIRALFIENRVYVGEFALQAKLRAGGNQLQPDASDPVACMAYAFRGHTGLTECNRQIARLERSWLRLLDLLRKLHKRPAAAITAPLPPDLAQPPPPPQVKPEDVPQETNSESSKNRKTVPKTDTNSVVQSMVNLYENALTEQESGEIDPHSTGLPPGEDPKMKQ
jgi:hypothetical protein